MKKKELEAEVQLMRNEIFNLVMKPNSKEALSVKIKYTAQFGMEAAIYPEILSDNDGLMKSMAIDGKEFDGL